MHAPYAVTYVTAKWFFEMASIPPAAFVFDDDLTTELESYAKK